MNNDMSAHTRRLAVKLGFAIALFVVLATSFAAMVRYREAMEITVAQHHTLTDKLDRMRRSIVEEREVIGRFKRFLPTDYGVKSPEWFVYDRLDEIKSRLAAPDMTINAVQVKDGTRTIHFSLKILHPDYSQVLNKLGVLETEVFPFVSISSIEISNLASEASVGLTMIVEGDVIMPDTAAAQGQSGQTVSGAAKP